MPPIEHAVLFHDPLSGPSTPDRPTKSFSGRRSGSPGTDGPAPARVSRRQQAVAEVLRDLKSLESRCVARGSSVPR